jgi:hypothetical protein
MKSRIRRVMGSENAWITPWLFNSKNRKLRNVRISKEGRHNFALSGVHIVLKDF